MRYELMLRGISRSFPAPQILIAGASTTGDVLILAGTPQLSEVRDGARYRAILVELGSECLAIHTGEDRGKEGSNVIGFARFRLGDTPPTNLVELVKQPATAVAAIDAAKAVLEGAGLTVAVCNDFPGRIIDRLLRPYLNAALRRLDEGLATAEDMDTTLKLGLGYPEGPIALLERTGLAAHYDVTQALFEALGQEAYTPARRAQVAKTRALKAGR